MNVSIYSIMPMKDSRPPSIAITSAKSVPKTPPSLSSFFPNETVSPNDSSKFESREDTMEGTLTPSPKDDSSSPKAYDPDTFSGSWDGESTLVRSSLQVSPSDKLPVRTQRTPSPNSTSNGFEYSLDIKRPLSNIIDNISTLPVEESLFPTSLPQDISMTTAMQSDSHAIGNDSKLNTMSSPREWTLETAKMSYGLNPVPVKPESPKIKITGHNFTQTS